MTTKMFKKFLATAAAVLAASAFMPSNIDAQNHTIEIAAHRGFWKCEKAKDSQNSIQALNLAQKNNFWGSEFDVHLTKDNVVIVNHDPDIDGIKIHQTNYTDLKDHKLPNGEHRPTLDEYLKKGAKSSNTVLVLEVKNQESDARTVQLTDICIQKLIDHNLYDPSRVIFISFSLAACKHIAQVAPEFTNQYLSGNIDPDTLHGYGINGIDYHYKVFYKNPEWVKRSHELGMTVNAWTVNKKADIQKMIDLGVDCITTNEPLLVREMLGDKEKRLDR